MNIVTVFEQFPDQKSCIAFPRTGPLERHPSMPILHFHQDNSDAEPASLLHLQDFL